MGIKGPPWLFSKVVGILTYNLTGLDGMPNIMRSYLPPRLWISVAKMLYMISLEQVGVGVAARRRPGVKVAERRYGLKGSGFAERRRGCRLGLQA